MEAAIPCVQRFEENKITNQVQKDDKTNDVAN